MRRVYLVRVVALCLFVLSFLAGSSSAQLIYQEGFNDDGDGTRYTMEGRGYEVTAVGPGMWEHNFNAPVIGLADTAPAKRAAILWNHTTFRFDFEPQAFEVWDNLVAWATDGKQNARIGFFPGFEFSFDSVAVLAERFEQQGHQVTEIPDVASLPAPAQLDLLIHTSQAPPDPATAFASYAVPGIFFDAGNHDDTLVAQIGPVVSFPDALSLNIVSENADHPVLAGLSDPVPWTNFPTDNMHGMGNAPPGGKVLLTYADPETGNARPALIVIEEGGGLLGSFGPQPEGAGFIVGADMDAAFGGGLIPRVLQLNPVDISGHSDVMLTVALAATDADFETNDYLRVMVGQSGDFPEDFITLDEFIGVDNAASPHNKGLSRDGGVTGLSPLEFTDITWDISTLAPDITNLVVRFEAFSTFPNEIIAIDNVRIFSGGIGPGGIPGDYNDSGQVEQADLDLVLLNWGQPTPPVPMGWTNDLPIGAIDQEELDKVLLNWGNTAGLGSAASVPEPGSLALIMVAAALALCARRQRSRTLLACWLRANPQT